MLFSKINHRNKLTPFIVNANFHVLVNFKYKYNILIINELTVLYSSIYAL